MEHDESEIRDKWKTAVQTSTISSVCHNAKGNFKKLLDAAELALTINPRVLGSEQLIILLTVIGKVGVYDYHLVGKMLDVFYEAEGSFFNLFVDALMTWDDVSDEDCKMAQYFLTIGARKWYDLGCGTKVRMIDVPLMNFTLAAMAVRRGRPNALRMFLRYGADPKAAHDGLVGLRWDTQRLPQKRKQALELLANALDRPTRELSALLPHLPRLNALKHLCKVVIRSRLAEAGYLPDGIVALDIPSELHQYLDLKIT